MKIFKTLKNGVIRFAKVSSVRIKAKSPEILMVCGAVSLVGAVIMAGKETLKAEEVLDRHNNRMETIKEAEEAAKDGVVTYTDLDMKKDKTTCFIQTGFDFVKLYSPCIILTVLSLCCFFTSFGIMKKRNLALTAWGMGIEKAFKDYRGRVVKELGEEEDKRFYYGFEKVNKTISKTETDKDGNSITTIEETDEKIDTVPFDTETIKSTKFVFARETSEYYDFDELRNDLMLNVIQKNMNRDLINYGHVFLNDVLKALGIKSVSWGQLIGWISGNHEGDGYIDFRIKKLYRKVDPFDRRRNPLGNEWEAYYELDFNTDGVIYDKI